MREEPHRLIFIDECATKTNMTRARGRARRGERVRDHAPHRHAGTRTFIAGLRYDRLVAPWILNGPMDAAAFETWVETQLLPTLWKGDVVILDNLAVHKSPKAAALLRAKGAWFLFLPKYSESVAGQIGSHACRVRTTRRAWPTLVARAPRGARGLCPTLPSLGVRVGSAPG